MHRCSRADVAVVLSGVVVAHVVIATTARISYFLAVLIVADAVAADASGKRDLASNRVEAAVETTTFRPPWQETSPPLSCTGFLPAAPAADVAFRVEGERRTCWQSQYHHRHRCQQKYAPYKCHLLFILGIQWGSHFLCN